MSRLVNDSVPRTLFRMALPMLAGTFAINAYNLTNAWFVSRLGTEALAAISFTFPVVMFLMFLTRGLSSGAMTQVAFALGARDTAGAARLAGHALMLAAGFGLLMAAAGLASAERLFTHLGASGAVLGGTLAYMRLWYLGAPVMALQIVAADLVMGSGHTRIISGIIVGSTVVNLVLDAGLIFGRFGLPRMGIAGAAVATILAQSASLSAALWFLGARLKLLTRAGMGCDGLAGSWGRILKYGLPGALGMVLTPISAAVLTRMVAHYGYAAVAATGVAGRIEMFAFMIPMTVGVSLIPFVAQNFGAGRLDRIRQARRLTMTFALVYGAFIGILWAFGAAPMARLFSTDPEVVRVLRTFVYITCAGYGMLEVHRYAGFCLTGVQEPLQASVLDVVRILVLLIPLSILGGRLLGLHGLFFARLATDLSAGTLGILWSGRGLARKTGTSAAVRQEAAVRPA